MYAELFLKKITSYVGLNVSIAKKTSLQKKPYLILVNIIGQNKTNNHNWSLLVNSKDKIDNAFNRIKELITLVNLWNKKASNKEHQQIEQRRQQLIDDLQRQKAELDRVWTEDDGSLSDREYVVQWEKINTRIKQLET